MPPQESTEGADEASSAPNVGPSSPSGSPNWGALKVRNLLTETALMAGTVGLFNVEV